MNYRFLLSFSLIFISFLSFSQQLEKMILEDWKDGAWVNRMQELPSYDDDGRLIKKEIAHWNSLEKIWENQTKTELDRAEDGTLLSKKTFKWDSELLNWSPSLKASYAMNSENKINSVLTEVYGVDGWKNQSIDEYEYSEDGRLIVKQQSRWNVSSLSWDTHRKYEYSIESGRKTGYIIYFRDNKINEWQSYKRAVYHYNTDETLDRIQFDTWIDGKWKKHSLRKNIHNDDELLDAVDVDVFDHESATWMKSTHVEYELTDFGKISTSTSQKWRSEAWENLQRSTYYYVDWGKMTSTLNGPDSEMELFPNPALERLTIRSLPAGQLTVLDAFGRIVLQTENIKQEMQLDISGWEMGTYSVQVDGNEVQQFVKQ